MIAASDLKNRYIVKCMKITVVILIAVGIGYYSYFAIRQNLIRRDPNEFYKWTLRRSPDSISANSKAAISYEKAGMHDEAADVYYRMLEQDPNHPDIYVNLAAIQVVKGNFEKAAELCEKAIALEPKNATAHNNLAVAYYTLGKYDLAIEHCDLAIKYGYKVKPQLLELLRPYRE